MCMWKKLIGHLFELRCCVCLRLRCNCGQATLEYAIVLLAIISIICALGVISHALNEGLLVEHAMQSAPYNVDTGNILNFLDVFLF
jgi:hypothetical protein